METAIDRAARYRKRAEELRERVASEELDISIKQQLRTIAAQYELLAKQAERGWR